MWNLKVLVRLIYNLYSSRELIYFWNVKEKMWSSCSKSTVTYLFLHHLLYSELYLVNCAALKRPQIILSIKKSSHGKLGLNTFINTRYHMITVQLTYGPKIFAYLNSLVLVYLERYKWNSSVLIISKRLHETKDIY